SLAACAIFAVAPASHVAAQANTSAGPWVKGFNSSVRLIAGSLPPGDASGKPKLLAGVEMRLADGWKTYWRHPGDDGGLPPSFGWSGSKNLRNAVVRYPAPHRIKGLVGTSLGYTTSVIFPVEIETDNVSKPVELALDFEFGICREICVPAEAKLKLVIPPTLAVMPPELAASYQKVPQPAPNAGAILKSAKAILTGATPAITLDLAAGAAGGKLDLFAEVVEGAFLPVAQKSGEPAQGIQRFRIDLKGVEEAPQLSGKTLRLTIMGQGAASEVTWAIK
ncbi:unnamed protein product, partial [Phaeothamnion confervicola]